jgi:hypothetical protein
MTQATSKTEECPFRSQPLAEAGDLKTEMKAERGSIT